MSEPHASADDARAIAKDAYIYASALLENYQTLWREVGDPAAPEYVGGFNRYRHYAQSFTPANHDIVTPNNDTPYSWAWFDLRAEPIVLQVPAVDRYYVVQLIDLFTHNFAYVGARATGQQAGAYLIAGPSWDCDTPPGIAQVLRCETELALTLTRVALDGPADLPNVAAIQQQLTLTPLSAFLSHPAPPPAPPIALPSFDRARAELHDFIGYLNFLLQFYPHPVPSEVALLERFATIGIGPGLAWDAATVDPTTLAAIDAGVADAQQEISATLERTFSSNGLFGTRAELGNDYLKRTMGALKGLYGNSIEEAWYGGYVGDGSTRYTITFAAGQLPPARFFWSLTMYRLPERWLVDNPIDRYSIGDRTAGLRTGRRLAGDLRAARQPCRGRAGELAAGAGGTVQRGGPRVRSRPGADRWRVDAAAAGTGGLMRPALRGDDTRDRRR